jgi:hypothetical protein
MPFSALRARLLAAIGAPASTLAFAAACGAGGAPRGSPVGASVPTSTEPDALDGSVDVSPAGAATIVAIDAQAAASDGGSVAAMASFPPPTTCARDETRASTSRPKFGVSPSSEGLSGQPCPSVLPPTAPDYPGVRMELDRAQTAGANPTDMDGRHSNSAVCVYTGCLPLSVARIGRVACAPPLEAQTACIDAPENGVSVAAPSPFSECPVGLQPHKPGPPFSLPAKFNAAMSTQGNGSPGSTRCCYDICGPHPRAPVPGRALRSDGAATVAAPALSFDWETTLALTEAIRGATDDVLAARWLAAAAFEHASIASFAKLSLQLLALGAPPDLLVDAHRAAIDEIDHARISYSLATRFSGVARGPGPLPIPVDTRPVSLVSLVRETLDDGAVNETLAALELHRAASVETDPRVKAALEQMALDEERHAALAWRILAWALARGGDDVASILRAEAARIGKLAPAEDSGARALREVVLPCLEAVLGADIGARARP